MTRAPLLVAALAVAGCLHGPSPMPETHHGEWARLRDRWTTQQTLYDRLDNRAFASATYQAPRLRDARVRRLAEWRSMNEVEMQAALAAERAEAERYEDFLVTFFTPDRRHNDLAQTASSWRIGLSPEGQGELLPLAVEEVVVDAALEALYPHIGHFDTVYRMRFPRPTGPGLMAVPFSLRIAGPVGRIEFKWTPQPEDLVPPPGEDDEVAAEQ